MRVSHSIDFFPEGDPMNGLAQHVKPRAGSLLICDQTVAHDKSSAPRYGIPIRLFDASILKDQKKRAANRAMVVAKEVDKSGFSDEMTELGRNVFGLNLNA